MQAYGGDYTYKSTYCDGDDSAHMVGAKAPPSISIALWKATCPFTMALPSDTIQLNYAMLIQHLESRTNYKSVTFDS